MDVAMVDGGILYRSLSNGIRFCASNVTSVADIESSWEFMPGYCCFLMIDGSHHAAYDDGNYTMDALPGQAMSMAIVEPINVRTKMRKGQHCRNILVSVSPDEIADGHLAEIVGEGMRRRETFWSWTPGASLITLGREVFSPLHANVTQELLIESLALQMLAFSLGDEPRAVPGRRHRSRRREIEALRAIHAMIAAEPERNYTLAGLAGQAGLSLSGLKAKFHEHYGHSVFSYLRQCRLERARALLEEDDISIAEIAYRLGYRHPANFSAAFRERFGHAPKASRPKALER